MKCSEDWEIQRTCTYIIQHGFERVTLQFPDDMLQDAPLVADTLQRALAEQGSAAKVYVLADTSYNPLSVDEVAAAHVNAECVVHYGYASLNAVSRIPAFCVLPKRQLDVQQSSAWMARQLTELCSSGADSNAEQQQCAVVCCDQGYMHLLPQLREAMLLAYQGPLQLVFASSAPLELTPASASRCTAAPRPPQQAGCSSRATCCHSEPQQPVTDTVPADSSSGGNCSASNCCIQQTSSGGAAQQSAAAGDQAPAVNTCSSSDEASTDSNYRPPIGGLVWRLPDSVNGSSMPQQPLMVWVGPADSSALTHLQLTHSRHSWVMLDPDSRVVHQGLAPGLDRLLKRRYYLVERARSATMIGLLVGTLGAAGYLQALTVLRELAQQAGKKTYTLLMGKPNPAKLANFPEIEVFVMLADPQGLILDSKEYLNPIITPHEAYLALTDREFDAATYKLDFGDLLQHELQRPGQTNTGEGPTCPAAVQVAGNVSSLQSDDSGSEEEDETAPIASQLGALVVAGATSKAVTLGASSRTGQQIQVHSAAQYLTQHRTYKGLETPATGGEILAAEKAVPGRSGRAAVYADEPAA